MQKKEYESMLNDWMADHPEYSNLVIGDVEKDESGNFVAYATDDKCTYVLHDYGDGNIFLDYIGNK